MNLSRVDYMTLKKFERSYISSNSKDLTKQMRSIWKKIFIEQVGKLKTSLFIVHTVKFYTQCCGCLSESLSVNYFKRLASNLAELDCWSCFFCVCQSQGWLRKQMKYNLSLFPLYCYSFWIPTFGGRTFETCNFML